MASCFPCSVGTERRHSSTLFGHPSPQRTHTALHQLKPDHMAQVVREISASSMLVDEQQAAAGTPPILQYLLSTGRVSATECQQGCACEQGISGVSGKQEKL